MALGDVTVSAEQWKDMADDILFLRCLEDAGVDNWSGHEYAVELYREERGEDA